LYPFAAFVAVIVIVTITITIVTITIAIAITITITYPPTPPSATDVCTSGSTSSSTMFYDDIDLVTLFPTFPDLVS